MSPIVFGYCFTFLTALLVIAGDTVIKLAADPAHATPARHLGLGIVLYGASALMWFGAMRHVTLAQGGVAYSMLTLLALCAIGAVWFDEPIRTREWLGIGCALAAILLMVRVA